MPIFIFKARNASGELITGEQEGENAASVKLNLANQGLFPTSVQSKGITFQLPEIFQRKQQVKPRELIALTRQFATLFKAGVAMDQIMATLIKQTNHLGLQKVLERIRIRPESFVTKLVGDPGFRLRVGEYRIIIDIDKEKLLILVIKIGHRSRIYKRR